MIELDGHASTVTALAYSPDGLTLASGGLDGRVKLWDPVAGRERLACVPLRGGAVSSVSFSGDGRLVAAGFPGHALVWSASSGQMLHWHRLSAETDHHPAPAFVAFHPSEERLAIAHARGPLIEVESRGDRRLTSFGHPQATDHAWIVPSTWRCLAYAGERVAAGVTDHVFLFGGAPATFHWPNGDFVSLAADASGRWLAGARGRGVALYDLTRLPDTRRARSFKVGDRVNAVALTPDGEALLAGGDDWTVHVWDVASGHKRAEFNWRVGQVVALAVAPDGMTVAVSGRKGPGVLVWDLE